MMSDYISTLNSATATSTGTSLYDTDDGSVMGKEDFMMLLVAQLKNQDPLSPDDPTEFTSQLAQFSSLEQLYNLNDSMESLSTSYADSDRLTTLGTIGKDVVFEGDEMTFSEDPVEFGYSLSGPASEVTISLRQNGATLATLNGTGLTTGNHFLTWEGLTDDGSAAPAGDYDIVISAKSASEDIILATPLIKSEVTGVDLSGTAGGTLVTLAGEVTFNSIIGVYEHGTSISTSTTDDDEEESDEESILDTLSDTAETFEETADSLETIENSVTS
ncbi:MAG: flagellar basal-body rod modification protein FlgD [Desulforhopalus sp.]|jgi:flagellar basal-body rod modification protein FlgD